MKGPEFVLGAGIALLVLALIAYQVEQEWQEKDSPVSLVLAIFGVIASLVGFITFAATLPGWPK